MKTSDLCTMVMLLVMLTLPVTMITSCSKGDNTAPGDNASFKPTDFQLTIISHGQGQAQSFYSLEYTVKNISNRKYDINNTDDLVVKCAVKDNNGNTYTVAPLIPTLDPGATEANKTTISLPTGVIANRSTFKAEVAVE